MDESYAVSWQGFDGRTHAGRLDVGPSSFHLEGGNGKGPVSYEVAYAQLEDVHVARRLDERLRGLPTLVLRWRSGATLRVACIAAPGALVELTEQLQRQLL
jgi:hypothetical protein